MVDRSMPEPSDEFASMRVEKYPKQLEIQLKNLRQRIQLAHTLIALKTVQRDITQGGVMQNFAAKENLRTAVNMRARELGWKEGRDWWA